MVKSEILLIVIAIAAAIACTGRAGLELDTRRVVGDDGEALKHISI
jgi:hypothetical protein